MTKDVFMCKKFTNPMRCGGYVQGKCSFCYKADRVGIEFCDICHQEIDDWEDSYELYHNPETGQDICKSCRQKGETL